MAVEELFDKFFLFYVNGKIVREPTSMREYSEEAEMFLVVSMKGLLKQPTVIFRELARVRR